MATLATAAPPAPATSPFERWYKHFVENRDKSAALPWQDPCRLNRLERRIIARSVQQFQLGEYARGRGFVRRANAHPAFRNDPEFVPTLQLFIGEEQEHSEILGRFLDREQIPRLKHNWVDGIFRRLRKLGGLEACAAVLVTAEVLAIPFYQALRDATGCRLLRAICVRILCDEAAHLNYQALTLGLIHRRLSARARAMRLLLHTMLFRGTALLVWCQHRRVFRAAEWDFRSYYQDAARVFNHLQYRIRKFAAFESLYNLDELRLD